MSANNIVWKSHFDLFCNIVEKVTGVPVIVMEESAREIFGEWGRLLVGETFIQIREKGENSDILEIMTDDQDLRQEILGAYVHELRKIYQEAQNEIEENSSRVEKSQDSA